jgi:hypothetical protein
MWSIWFAWLVGQRPSRELVEAAKPLRLGDRLQGRRLVLRGRAADQVPVARYAVAVARRAQRARPVIAGLLVLAAAVGIFVFFTLRELERHDKSSSVILLAAAAALCAWQCLRTARSVRSAPAAELANMRFLEQAGHPYPADADPAPMPMPAPWLATVAAIPITFMIYDLIYGTLTLATDGKTVTLVRAGERGAVWAALMTFFMTVLGRSRQDEQAGRPTAGTASAAKQ